MKAPLIGFTGASAEKRALKESRAVPPRTYALPDGSLVGVGLTRPRFIDGMDRLDTALHGVRLSRGYVSDFTRHGGARAWLDLTTVERARQQKRLAK